MPSGSKKLRKKERKKFIASCWWVVFVKWLSKESAFYFRPGLLPEGLLITNFKHNAIWIGLAQKVTTTKWSIHRPTSFKMQTKFYDFTPILSYFQCYYMPYISNFMTNQCGADLISIADLILRSSVKGYSWSLGNLSCSNHNKNIKQ